MSTTEKRSMQTYDGLTDEARTTVLRDLAEFVEHVQTSLADGTFHAAIFTMMKDAEEKSEDGNPMAQICGYRHGFVEATDLLMQDTIDRYELFKMMQEMQEDGHAH